jgi:hypothetical protein
MADAQLPIGPIQITGTAECVARPNAIKLDAYPLLVFAPEQYGKGIRTEDNGTPVSDIAIAYSVNANAEAIAAQFATGVGHVLQAIQYAFATGLARATQTTAPSNEGT